MFVSVFAEAGRSGGRRRLAALRAVRFLHTQQHFFSAALAFTEPPERGGAAPNPANPERPAGRGGARCHLYNPKKPSSRKWYDTHFTVPVRCKRLDVKNRIVHEACGAVETTCRFKISQLFYTF